MTAATHPLTPIAIPTAASLVITTKNRKDELRLALTSARSQTARLDVIVIDDASSDGTPEMVRAEFPEARLFSNPSSVGYMAGRNQGARLATGEVIFSIDDDAEFSTPLVVEQTLRDFDNPRIGAVAIPFSDVRKSPIIYQRAIQDREPELISHYIGTAHAIRRDAFLASGLYRAEWIHQGEEMDLCLRMLSRGYVVRAGRADIVKHYESPKRDLTRMHIFGRRNDILYAWCNVPAAAFPVHLLGTMYLGVRAAIRNRCLPQSLQGMWSGLIAIPRLHRLRRPVPMKVYRLMRYLRRNANVRLTQVEPLLPALRR